MKLASILLALTAAACAPNTFVWTKPGITQAEADRDRDQCKARADQAAARQLTSARERSQAHNRILVSCMRDRAYVPEEEAAAKKT